MSEWFSKATFAECLERAAESWGPREALVHEGRRISFAELRNEVDTVARGLIALGVGPNDKVVLWMPNRPEWLYAFFALSQIGAIVVPANTRFRANDLEYVVRQSDSTTLITVDRSGPIDYLALARAIIPEIASGPNTVLASAMFPELERVIVLGSDVPSGAIAWSDMVARGKAITAASLWDRVRQVKPADTTLIMYSSGTTGFPKAVMISHDNVTWVVASFAAFVGFGKAPGGRERLVSYLPLSHIAAQAIDIYAGLVCTGRDGVQSSTLYFARPDALKGSLKDTLNAVRPTVFFGVPRVWEKFAEALQAVGAKTTGAKKKISTWAKRVALRRYLAGVAGAEPEDLGLVGGALSSVEEVFADLILKKVHAAIGLDKAHFVFTGAAPIATVYQLPIVEGTATASELIGTTDVYAYFNRVASALELTPAQLVGLASD